MPKQEAVKNYNIDVMQPDELNELKAVVREFVTRLRNVDNEINLLKEDRSALIDEYSTKLDMKTLNAALRVSKIKQGVQHVDTFDTFITVLEEESYE